MKEVWKDIDGFEGLYQVSNLGRVKSLTFRNGTASIPSERILHATDNGHGYLIVQLHNERRTSKYVHRLVAEAFCDRREGCDCVNHIDYDKRNNIWTNLEWCTQAENVRYSADRMRKQKSICKPTKTGEKGIYLRRKRYRVVVHKKEYPSQRTLEEAIALRDRAVAEMEAV